MLKPPGLTLQTTFALQLLVGGQWEWYGDAQYTSADDVRALLREIYGGAYGGSNHHRIVMYQPSILD